MPVLPSPDVKTIYADVSFMSTPLIEIGPKAQEILALGWTWEKSLPEHWLARFSKDINESEASADPVAELKAVMGDYWYEPQGHLMPPIRW